MILGIIDTLQSMSCVRDSTSKETSSSDYYELKFRQDSKYTLLCTVSGRVMNDVSSTYVKFRDSSRSGSMNRRF